MGNDRRIERTLDFLAGLKSEWANSEDPRISRARDAVQGHVDTAKRTIDAMLAQEDNESASGRTAGQFGTPQQEEEQGSWTRKSTWKGESDSGLVLAGRTLRSMAHVGVVAVVILALFAGWQVSQPAKDNTSSPRPTVAAAGDRSESSCR